MEGHGLGVFVGNTFHTYGASLARRSFEEEFGLLMSDLKFGLDGKVRCILSS